MDEFLKGVTTKDAIEKVQAEIDALLDDFDPNRDAERISELSHKLNQLKQEVKS